MTTTINLKIPSSVKSCTLQNIFIGELIFEGYTRYTNGSTQFDELNLTLNNA